MSRETYLLNQEPQETDQLWAFLLEFFRPIISEAFVDAYPAPIWGEPFAELPEHVKQAQALLADLGRSQREGRDPLMAIKVVPGDESWHALRVFGPHSIHVELHTPSAKRAVLVNHDGGNIYARLKTDELVRLVSQAKSQGIDIGNIIEKAKSG
jgi:hypothetical protein